MKIYVATSWKNVHYGSVVTFLRGAGHDVYDFRHEGFGWRQVDDGWQSWDVHRYLKALQHPTSAAGFKRDMDALRACDACVVVLPSGRSAHLEAGWAAGAGKRLIVYIPEYDTPELMYLAADAIVTTLDDVRSALLSPGEPATGVLEAIPDVGALAVADVAQYIKDRIALCGHGTISVTCGPCTAPWLQR